MFAEAVGVVLVGVGVLVGGNVGMAVNSAARVAAKAVEVAFLASAVGVPDQAAGVGALRLQAMVTKTKPIKAQVLFISFLISYLTPKQAQAQRPV
jgi:uncharacterized membrane protein (Fun14 family)